MNKKELEKIIKYLDSLVVNKGVRLESFSIDVSNVELVDYYKRFRGKFYADINGHCGEYVILSYKTVSDKVVFNVDKIEEDDI